MIVSADIVCVTIKFADGSGRTTEGRAQRAPTFFVQGMLMIHGGNPRRGKVLRFPGKESE